MPEVAQRGSSRVELESQAHLTVKPLLLLSQCIASHLHKHRAANQANSYENTRKLLPLK